jgi:type IV secretory pathway TrbF-like protein
MNKKLDIMKSIKQKRNLISTLHFQKLATKLVTRIRKNKMKKSKGSAPKLTSFIEEINELKEGQKLLKQVWDDLYPLGRGKISEKTLSALNEYFDSPEEPQDY